MIPGVGSFPVQENVALHKRTRLGWAVHWRWKRARVRRRGRHARGLVWHWWEIIWWCTCSRTTELGWWWHAAAAVWRWPNPKRCSSARRHCFSPGSWLLLLHLVIFLVVCRRTWVAWVLRRQLARTQKSSATTDAGRCRAPSLPHTSSVPRPGPSRRGRRQTLVTATVNAHLTARHIAAMDGFSAARAR